MAAVARIGMVNFINTAPFYSVWQKEVTNASWQVVEAAPSHLCRMLNAGELDMGIVSSHEYARNPQAYVVVDGLSISSSGPVGSVCLFSREDSRQLDGKYISLSPQSQTSNSLIKIILEEFYHLHPNYLSGERQEQHLADALLAIGDEALRLRMRRAYRYQLDLGEIWHNHTGLPFVFALWVVRKSFWRKHRDLVQTIQQTLLACIKKGKEQLVSISKDVAPLIPMPEQECFEYLSGLEYDLDDAKKLSLERFFGFLISRHDVEPGALPVRYCL